MVREIAGAVLLRDLLSERVLRRTNQNLFRLRKIVESHFTAPTQPFPRMSRLRLPNFQRVSPLILPVFHMDPDNRLLSSEFLETMGQVCMNTGTRRSPRLHFELSLCA